MLDPRLIERFRADLARVWPEVTNGPRLGIAVSGGPDSLALLLLANATLPGRIAAATVDHGLRPESAAEAGTVARVCAARAVPHTVLSVEVGSGNMQAQARTARYAALADWAEKSQLSAVATAHHADDQAETLLMRLNRGSGLGGLAGVRARRELTGDCLLIRPLLGWRKAELETVCVNAKVEPVRDPFNDNAAFDRVRLRRELNAADWLNVPAIARSVAHLADAEEALAQWLELRWREDVVRDGEALRYRPQGPRYVRLKLLERAIA